ncbi:MAG TPA: isoprenylcysteine carboxylmethyltransferase family protein [Puia sp.]|jgi:protein-S-isoprenylcysteine O-methyltransferase Ste14|nr:isoprenylcysteine carboxylmethyltransferase family protein [Puia sp.]
MNLIGIEKTMWSVIFIYWLVSSFAVKKTVKRQSGKGRILYIICVLTAFMFLFGNYFSIDFLDQTVFPQTYNWRITGLIFCALGLTFSLMARIWLGGNWSGRITVKENHELIQSGPYAVTRNPIYTGFLLAFIGCSMTLGQVKGYIGIIFLVACILIKVFQEETFMLDAFGDKFTAYKSKVKRLIPFIY